MPVSCANQALRKLGTYACGGPLDTTAIEQQQPKGDGQGGGDDDSDEVVREFSIGSEFGRLADTRDAAVLAEEQLEEQERRRSGGGGRRRRRRSWS